MVSNQYQEFMSIKTSHSQVKYYAEMCYVNPFLSVKWHLNLFTAFVAYINVVILSLQSTLERNYVSVKLELCV